MAGENRKWVLKARPHGLVERGNFEWREEAVPSVGDGQFLLRNLLAAWAGAGKIKNQVDVVTGLENAPDALRRLFTAENLGKQLVEIADPSL